MRRTRDGAITSPSCSATSCISSRCRWRSPRTISRSSGCCATSRCASSKARFTSSRRTGVVDLTEEEHFDIVRRKTAYLFAGCAKIGGMLGPDSTRAAGGAVGVRPQHRHGLSDRGRSAGLHRRGGDAGKAGRRRSARRKDDAAGHSSAVAQRRRRAMRSCAGSSASERPRVDEWRELRALLAQTRSIDYAHNAAVEFVERAKKCAACVPVEPDARDALLFLPDYVFAIVATASPRYADRA